ncbi:hypothetical protein KIH23_11425 [Flavobacterium sp. CYK-55]|uniref:hypothetical protein n=1 Tax=Flavobacterium sp. CYK-55 TaxID=2835529 RepID=UPI001BCD3D88|nr:hypothetical protein [Flavobacterium sp. CYK-55]MBS7787907.1 hypothetical protein [Flavobacterium sp. CYK-55]
MNTRDIDLLNVILIIVSLFLAFHVPYEMFLFSYAFLGPLHYLTEINWLKEKNYFSKNTKWIWLFVGLSLVVSLPFLQRIDAFSWAKASAAKSFFDWIVASTDEILLISLLFAIGLIHFKNMKYLWLFLAGSTAVAIPTMYFLPHFSLGVLIFVPTLIHVYLFTFLFMIYGTMNSKSQPGIIAIVLMFLVPVIIWMSKINPVEYYNLSDKNLQSFQDSGFAVVGGTLSDFINGQKSTQYAYMSVMGIKIQIFIAFAYTYHYLNWFSKTSIIGWGKNLNGNKLKTILAIWAISCGLYIYNFKIGFIALSFLSLAHVFLEFPLNITSIKGIWLKLKPSR